MDSLEKNRFNLTEAQSSLLTPSGEKEQEGLGQRFSQRFPDLFGKKPFDPNKYKVRHFSCLLEGRDNPAVVSKAFSDF